HAAERYLRDHLAYLIRHAPDSAERYVTEGRVGLCLLYRKARAEGEEKLRLAHEWVAPRIRELKPAELAEFRDFQTSVGPVYEEAGDKYQAEIWKGRRMDLEIPASPIASE